MFHVLSFIYFCINLASRILFKDKERKWEEIENKLQAEHDSLLLKSSNKVMSLSNSHTLSVLSAEGSWMGETVIFIAVLAALLGWQCLSMHLLSRLKYLNYWMDYCTVRFINVPSGWSNLYSDPSTKFHIVWSLRINYAPLSLSCTFAFKLILALHAKLRWGTWWMLYLLNISVLAWSLWACKHVNVFT